MTVTTQPAPGYWHGKGWGIKRGSLIEFFGSREEAGDAFERIGLSLHHQSLLLWIGSSLGGTPDVRPGFAVWIPGRHRVDFESGQERWFVKARPYALGHLGKKAARIETAAPVQSTDPTYQSNIDRSTTETNRQERAIARAPAPLRQAYLDDLLPRRLAIKCGPKKPTEAKQAAIAEASEKVAALEGMFRSRENVEKVVADALGVSPKQRNMYVPPDPYAAAEKIRDKFGLDWAERLKEAL